MLHPEVTGGKHSFRNPDRYARSEREDEPRHDIGVIRRAVEIVRLQVFQYGKVATEGNEDQDRHELK